MSSPAVPTPAQLAARMTRPAAAVLDPQALAVLAVLDRVDPEGVAGGAGYRVEARELAASAASGSLTVSAFASYWDYRFPSSRQNAGALAHLHAEVLAALA